VRGSTDTNPPRITPTVSSILASVDGFKVHGAPLHARVTIVSVFNSTALYNFCRRFAGTPFVTTRTIQGELSVRF